MRQSILLLVVSLPLAWAQTNTTSAPATPASADHWNLIDKVMGMAGPSERTEMTEKQRFHLYAFSLVGPVPVVAEAVGAGLSQWQNDPKEWGQGWGAYGKRFDTNMAYNGVRQTITYGMSAALHEDNRYFSSRKRGFWARTGYALVSTVAAEHPDGRRVFSVSGTAGVVGAAAVASVWEPKSWEGMSGVGRNIGLSLGTTAAFNVVREFLPDILHRPQR